LNWLRVQPEFQRATVAMLSCCSAAMVMETFSGMKKDRDVFELYPSGVSRVHLPTQSLDVIWR